MAFQSRQLMLGLTSGTMAPALLLARFHIVEVCRNLPDQLQPELNLAIGCRRTADRIKRPDLRESNRSGWETAARIEIRIRVDERVRHGKDRMIQQVEEFSAKL